MASLTSGLHPRFKKVEVPPQEGEVVIRHHIRSAWAIWGNYPVKDSLFEAYLGGGAGGGLVLTNRRLLWIYPHRVSLDIPLNSVRSAKATKAVSAGFLLGGLLFSAGVATVVYLLTRRLQVDYESADGDQMVRFHIPDPKGWAESIIAAASANA